MIVQIRFIRGTLRFVHFDSHGDGLPIIDRRGAYRRSIYRPPGARPSIAQRWVRAAARFAA